jgi:alpha-L-fucosidase
MKTIITAILFVLFIHSTSGQSYEPTWESIDSRPVPEWFMDAKFGIFIHWGVFSVPAYRPVSTQMYQTYAEWYEARVMNPGDPGYDFHVKNYGKDFRYRDFACGRPDRPVPGSGTAWIPALNATFWAILSNRSGQKG